jgi:hypothetical protein
MLTTIFTRNFKTPSPSLIHAIVETRFHHVHVDTWGTIFEIVAFIRAVVGNSVSAFLAQ